MKKYNLSIENVLHYFRVAITACKLACRKCGPIIRTPVSLAYTALTLPNRFPNCFVQINYHTLKRDILTPGQAQHTLLTTSNHQRSSSKHNAMPEQKLYHN